MFGKSTLKLAPLSISMVCVPLLVIWKLRAMALYLGKTEYSRVAPMSE